MARLLIITTLWFVSISSAIADIQVISDGRSLIVSCQQALAAVDSLSTKSEPEKLAPDTQNNAFICFSYLSGIIGAAQYTESLAELRYAQAIRGKANFPKLGIYCIDWNIQYQKAARIVLKFAQQNPEELGKPAQKLALHALQSAFPCR